MLISEPVPTRLADLAAYPASAGFPPEHPPMTGFPGVPIRIGDKVFGHLYLTERYDGGGFTAEDSSRRLPAQSRRTHAAILMTGEREQA